jgi:hypothetical protein
MCCKTTTIPITATAQKHEENIKIEATNKIAHNRRNKKIKSKKDSINPRVPDKEKFVK